ncbi:MAG: hypothetical protein IK080_01845 [Clostridia bacterium]|nr:hypothetical protein [Clostridia bacterium]
MKLSGVPENRVDAEYLTSFGGYVHKPSIADGEFYDMKNMSGKDAPLAATRQKRGELPLLYDGAEVRPIGAVGMDQLLLSWMQTGDRGYWVRADLAAHDVDPVDDPEQQAELNTLLKAWNAAADAAAQTKLRVRFTPDPALGSDPATVLQGLETLLTGMQASGAAPYNGLYVFTDSSYDNLKAVKIYKYLTPRYDAEENRWYWEINWPSADLTIPRGAALYIYAGTNLFMDRVITTDTLKYLSDSRLKMSAFAQALKGKTALFAKITKKDGTVSNGAHVWQENLTIRDIRDLNAVEQAAARVKGDDPAEIKMLTFDRTLNINKGLGLFVKIGSFDAAAGGGNQAFTTKAAAKEAAADAKDAYYEKLDEYTSDPGKIYSVLGISYKTAQQQEVNALTSIEYDAGARIELVASPTPSTPDPEPEDPEADGVRWVYIQRPHGAISSGYRGDGEMRIFMGKYDPEDRTIQNATNICAAQEDAEHKLVRMGANLIIFPEKYMINTAGGAFNDVQALEKETAIRDGAQGAGGTWQYQMCDYQGTVYDQTGTASATAPTEPSNGDLWLDTSGKEPQWKQWSSTLSCWNDITCYVKLRSTRLLVTKDGAQVCPWEAGDAVELQRCGALTALRPAEGQTHFVLLQAGTETVDSVTYGYIVFLCNLAGVNASNKPIFDTQTDIAASGDVGVGEYEAVTLAPTTGGGHIAPDGTFTQSTGYSNTYYTSDGAEENPQPRKIPAVPGDQFLFETTESNKIRAVCAYDGSTVKSGKGQDGWNATYTVPEGIDGVVLSVWKPAKGTMKRARSLRKLVIRRTVPELDYVIECNNRLWGCRYGEQDGKFVNEIFACKQGDPTNWHYFGNTALDSYYVSLGDPGRFTGAAAYHNGQSRNPIFFREDKLHRIYGSYPANYNLQTADCAGVAPGSDRSLTVLGGVLYYHSQTGIMAYTGYLPQSISDAFGDVRYHDAVAGAIGNEVYFSMTADGGAQALLVWNDRLKCWHKEDDLQADAFVPHGSELYAVAQRTGIVAMHGRAGLPEADFDFAMQTGEIGYASPLRKKLLKVTLRLHAALGTRARLLIRYDGGAWIPCGELEARDGMHSQPLHIRPARCDRFALRLEGHGALQLMSMAKYYEEGSDYD